MSEITSVTCEPALLDNIQCIQFGTCSTDQALLPFLNVKWVLGYVTQGSGLLRTKEAEVEVKEGSVFALFPDQLIRTHTDAPFFCHWLRLDGSAVPELLVACRLTAQSPAVSTAGPRCRQLFLQLAGSEAESETSRLSLLFALLDALQHETAFRRERRMDHLQQRYVSRAISYIEKNYANDISVEDVAEYCRLNRSYLGKLFRDSLGITTQEYLIQTRMKAACRYLAMGAAPIGVISRSVGYPNQLHFSRAFRKVFGIPPREWQKQNRTAGADTAALDEELDE